MDRSDFPAAAGSPLSQSIRRSYSSPPPRPALQPNYRAARFHPVSAAILSRCRATSLCPQVLAAIILWGQITAIRSSRKLECALSNLLDFRWLTGELQVDHTTLSQFRKTCQVALKALFVQVIQVARQLDLVSFTEVAIDGTRMRANNRRTGSRTPAELVALAAELAAQFEQQEVLAQAENAVWQDPTSANHSITSLIQAASHGCLQANLLAAVAEVQRLQQAGDKLPSRIPVTDPHSRIMPNKEGGFAPNYTPTILTETQNGFILDGDVTNGLTDEAALIPAIDRVEATLKRETPIERALGDGAFGTGHNLAGLEARHIEFYRPIDAVNPLAHPAQRDDLTQPVSEAQLAQLAMLTKPKAGQLPVEERQQFAKGAFVYVAEEDDYYFPAGKRLAFTNSCAEQRKNLPDIERSRYKSEASDCAACPLKSRCLQGKSQRLIVTHDEFEGVRGRVASRMAQPGGQAIYRRRRHAAETPFAQIKQRFRARQFLLRGLPGIRIEWTWLTMAFNVKMLMGLKNLMDVTK